MKLEIEKKDLHSLVSRAQNIVEKRNTMPVLINVLMEAKENKLTIFATDLEVSLTTYASASIQETGKVAVNAKSLFDIVKELPDGPISLERKENNWLKLQQNKAQFNIVGISPEEYPVFPTFNTDEFVEFDANILFEMIEKTIYSVSNDETRYHLNGVYFENQNTDQGQVYRMVATDGHRLSLVDRKIVEGDRKAQVAKGVIIPRKGLNEIRKMIENVEGEFEMAVEGSQLVVRHDSTVLMIRLIEGRYPNYQQLIPQTLKQNLIVRREDFQSCLKRVSLLSNQKSKGVTLSLKNGMLEISSNNPELGDAKEEIEVDYKGEDLKIGFNAKYLLDVLNSMSAEMVDISFNDQLSPGLMKPHQDEAYRCVVMPMRI